MVVLCRESGRIACSDAALWGKGNTPPPDILEDLGWQKISSTERNKQVIVAVFCCCGLQTLVDTNTSSHSNTHISVLPTHHTHAYRCYTFVLVTTENRFTVLQDHDNLVLCHVITLDTLKPVPLSEMVQRTLKLVFAFVRFLLFIRFFSRHNFFLLQRDLAATYGWCCNLKIPGNFQALDDVCRYLDQQNPLNCRGCEIFDPR